MVLLAAVIGFSGCDMGLHNQADIIPEIEDTDFAGVKIFVPQSSELSHVWWWDAEGSETASNSESGWPGDAMEEAEADSRFWVYELEDATSLKVIFNNEGEGEQTADLEVDEQGVYYLTRDRQLVKM